MVSELFETHLPYRRLISNSDSIPNDSTTSHQILALLTRSGAKKPQWPHLPLEAREREVTGAGPAMALMMAYALPLIDLEISIWHRTIKATTSVMAANTRTVELVGDGGLVAAAEVAHISRARDVDNHR